MKKNKIDKTVEDVKQIVKALVNTAEDIHAQVFSAGTRCLKMPADLGPKSELRESLYEDQLELLSIPSLALVAIVSSPPPLPCQSFEKLKSTGSLELRAVKQEDQTPC